MLQDPTEAVPCGTCGLPCDSCGLAYAPLPLAATGTNFPPPNCPPMLNVPLAPKTWDCHAARDCKGHMLAPLQRCTHCPRLQVAPAETTAKATFLHGKPGCALTPRTCPAAGGARGFHPLCWHRGGHLHELSL